MTAPKKRIQQEDRILHGGHLELPGVSRPLRPRVLQKTGKDKLVRADLAGYWELGGEQQLILFPTLKQEILHTKQRCGNPSHLTKLC